MRKLLLAITLLTTLNTFSQITILSEKDDMTDKVYYQASEGLICANTEMSKGFRIDPKISEEKGLLTIKNLIITMAGLESCNEENTLIILFDNEEKITINSWNKFNCKGLAYFSISNSNIEILKSNKVSKIRVTNGKSFKSFTKEIEYKTYFIDLFKALNQNKDE